MNVLRKKYIYTKSNEFMKFELVDLNILCFLYLNFRRLLQYTKNDDSNKILLKFINIYETVYLKYYKEKYFTNTPQQFNGKYIFMPTRVCIDKKGSTFHRYNTKLDEMQEYIKNISDNDADIIKNLKTINKNYIQNYSNRNELIIIKKGFISLFPDVKEIIDVSFIDRLVKKIYGFLMNTIYIKDDDSILQKKMIGLVPIYDYLKVSYTNFIVNAIKNNYFFTSLPNKNIDMIYYNINGRFKDDIFTEKLNIRKSFIGGPEITKIMLNEYFHSITPKSLKIDITDIFDNSNIINDYNQIIRENIKFIKNLNDENIYYKNIINDKLNNYNLQKINEKINTNIRQINNYETTNTKTIMNFYIKFISRLYTLTRNFMEKNYIQNIVIKYSEGSGGAGIFIFNKNMNMDVFYYISVQYILLGPFHKKAFEEGLLTNKNFNFVVQELKLPWGCDFKNFNNYIPNGLVYINNDNINRFFIEFLQENSENNNIDINNVGTNWFNNYLEALRKDSYEIHEKISFIIKYPTKIRIQILSKLVPYSYIDNNGVKINAKKFCMYIPHFFSYEWLLPFSEDGIGKYYKDNNNNIHNISDRRIVSNSLALDEKWSKLPKDPYQNIAVNDCDCNIMNYYINDPNGKNRMSYFLFNLNESMINLMMSQDYKGKKGNFNNGEINFYYAADIILSENGEIFLLDLNTTGVLFTKNMINFVSDFFMYDMFNQNNSCTGNTEYNSTVSGFEKKFFPNIHNNAKCGYYYANKNKSNITEEFKKYYRSNELSSANEISNSIVILFSEIDYSQ